MGHNFQLNLTPEFTAQMERKPETHWGKDIDEARNYPLIMLVMGFQGVTPFSIKHFDPNASFTVKSEHGPIEIPVLTAVFFKATTDNLREFLKSSSNHIRGKDILKITNPNGDGQFANAIYQSAKNFSWNIFALLEHPEINPNVDWNKVKYADMTLAAANWNPESLDDGNLELSNDNEKILRWGDSLHATPLEILVSRYHGISIGNINLREIDVDVLKAHLADAIVFMVHAGAVITPTARKTLENYDELLDRIDVIQDYLSAAFTSPDVEISVQDFKHMHAFGRLRDQFMKAQDDDVLSDKLLAVRDDLPKWLQDEYAGAFDILQSSWRDDMLARRSSETSRGGRE